MSAGEKLLHHTTFVLQCPVVNAVLRVEVSPPYTRQLTNIEVTLNRGGAPIDVRQMFTGRANSAKIP